MHTIPLDCYLKAINSMFGQSLLFVLLAVFQFQATSAFDWAWHTGRATHYGGPGDPWSIHNGYCGYGYLDPNVGTGWDIAAPSDQNWDFDGHTGNCGACYEVGCEGMNFKDFYGNWLERQSVCYDSSSTVVVMVSDICPCVYPANQYSNKRWCCGDMQHFDVSIFAFQKLADIKWGVIGIKYRRVPCDYKPERRAELPSGQSSVVSSQAPPWNWDSSKDKRWAVLSSSASTGVTTTDSSSQSSSVSKSHSDSAGQKSVGQQSSLINAYYGGFMQGWSDTGSWGVRNWDRDSSWSFNGQQAYCATLNGYGGVQYNAWPGAFSSKWTLELYVRLNNGGIPDINIKLSAPSGYCRSLRLNDFIKQDQTSDWVRLQVRLSAFDWRSGDGNDHAFSGCSDSINDWSVNTLTFLNNWGGDQDLCMDEVKLF